MNIFIGADHRGFEYKKDLNVWLSGLGHTVVDCGNTMQDPNDDYPDFGFAVGDAVVNNPGSLGIVMCGSGGGICIAANKVKGVLSRITIGATVNNQIVMLFYKRINN